jgi:hypothetical protein
MTGDRTQLCRSSRYADRLNSLATKYNTAGTRSIDRKRQPPTAAMVLHRDA